jgi:SAM-dependent methyltransferase
VSTELVSKDFIFKKENNKLIFVGDFDGLYLEENLPWGQDGSDERLKNYYIYSRNNIVSFIKKHTHEAESLFEVGCGLGYVVNFISKNSHLSCSGADISEVAIKKAKETFPMYNFFNLDIQKKPLQHSFKYDIILFNQALWYVLENLDCVFENFYSMLNKNGTLIIVNAFLEEQNYGKDIINGFGGLINYIETHLKQTFQLKEASLYFDESILHKDGIIVLRKNN